MSSTPRNVPGAGAVPGRSLLEVTEDPLEALYGYFNLKLTPSPATLAELGATFDMRVSREGRMPTHLLAVHQPDGNGSAQQGDASTVPRAILMLPIDRMLFERGFKLNLDQPEGGADDDEEDEDEEDDDDDDEDDEEDDDDEEQTRSLAPSSSSSSTATSTKSFGSTTSSSSHINHIGGTHPSALPRPHTVYTSTPNPSNPSPTPTQTPTLMVTVPVIPMQVPHVRSLALLLLYGMGLERNTNLLAWSLLPVSVVEEFPNAAEMAMILARMRESVFDGIYRHNQGMWKNVLKFGFGAGGRTKRQHRRGKDQDAGGGGARDRRREEEDAKVVKVVQTAWNVSAEARKLRRAGAHLGLGSGGHGSGSGSGRNY